MIKTIVKTLPNDSKIIILYDDNFVSRQKALSTMNYHRRVFHKNYTHANQTKLL